MQPYDHHEPKCTRVPPGRQGLQLRPAHRHCLTAGAKSVVCCSHLGRPDGNKVTAATCRAERRVLEFWSFVAGVSVRLEWWTSWAPHVLNSLTRNPKHPETPEDRRFLFPRGQVAQVVLDQIGEEAAGMIGEEAAGMIGEEAAGI